LVDPFIKYQGIRVFLRGDKYQVVVINTLCPLNLVPNNHSPKSYNHFPTGQQRERRTDKEPQLADCGVQSIWAKLADNWSETSVSLLKAALKQSTISKYDALLINCAAFCERINETFPPCKVNVIAEWLVEITASLRRSKPTLKQAMAALSAINIKGDIPIHDPLIRRLKKGIINVRTSRPLKSAVLFDVPQLIRYIQRQPCLSFQVERLKRQSTIALSRSYNV
jgi:hypothetical protein